jgi:hypothetical protein
VADTGGCPAAGGLPDGRCIILHHHLSGFSTDVDHTPPQYSSPNEGLMSLLRVHESMGTSWTLANNQGVSASDDVVQYFCGWHNSAYAEECAHNPAIC